MLASVIVLGMTGAVSSVVLTALARVGGACYA